VLDGTRLDLHYRFLLGTDGRATRGREHVVYLQNHDQVGNRLGGDRMVATYGRDLALLGATAVMASPYLPMLFMGEEYGETAPFLFFEDFSDPALVEAVRAGRRSDFAFGGREPPPPHDRATFEASRLRWERLETAEGRATLDYYRRLIALKRAGALGPLDRSAVQVTADEPRQLIRLEAPRTLTLLNLSGAPPALDPLPGWRRLLDSVPGGAAAVLPPHGARVLGREGVPGLDALAP
jgi:maltooligosyltrehalose trehalohydrolase